MTKVTPAAHDLASDRSNTIAYLRSPQAIRDRCHQLFDLALQNQLSHFRCDLDKLPTTANYVLQVMHSNYPDLQVPFHSRWRHFTASGVDRLQNLQHLFAKVDPLEIARSKVDLAVTSVLLDAGAGAQWQYQEPQTGVVLQRSEGLAIASFHAFLNGTFSSDPAQPYQADAAGLANLSLNQLAQAFQVSDANPLVGLEGRLTLLKTLGEVLQGNPQFFGKEHPRPGHLVDYLLAHALVNASPKTLPAPAVLQAVLESMGDIWPGRIRFGGVNLGDVWEHSALIGDQPGAQLVPFHKLSQWLTYSLLEPIQELGVKITDLDQLTGLAEYRNGGLCVDLGLLVPLHEEVLTTTHQPGSEVIVEWRALTVALLDRIADTIRQSLNLSATELPLVKVLEGGTWAAGRRIAAEKRIGGIPPIQIQSDGTVF
jgi:hypothetical protein